NLQKKIAPRWKYKGLILERWFWHFLFKKGISHVYVLTKSSTDYYFPIVDSFKNREKICVKYTTIFYAEFHPQKKKLLNSIKYNIVTSEKQKFFFQNTLDIPHTVVQEVIINNEEEAFKRKISNHFNYDFGILARFSEEKQLEHAIEVIRLLKEKGKLRKMIIRGDGVKTYYWKL
ncbi:hypothetical protein HC175_17250, partial [Salinimicrobium sp. CDJ15-91]|nr:hypothetical protein [Salinimicrobium oceani]